MPAWVRHAMFWHLYPLGFLNAEKEATGTITHRLPALVPWLDYAVELGASGILLGPIFASSTHGYDTIDHFRIDPRLGDEADFDALVEAARARGLRLVLDGVFNHVGRDFPLFREALHKGRRAPEAEWFRLSWPEDGGAPRYDNFEGHDQLVALNHEAPAVADHVARVMTHWLERGASGWRLDAAYAVPPAFWEKVLPRVREAHPEAYVFGEVIHGDYAGIVSAAGFDAVTQYELWKALWSSLNDRNLFELAWALERHNGFLDAFVPQTFVGNHDVTRIASRLSEPKHLAHALLVLMTVGGTPSVYAGDEQGFRGVKEERLGGDDAVRPAFPASAGELSELGAPILRLHQDLIGLRRRHPWLHAAKTKKLSLSNEQLSYRSEAEGEAIVVALNLASSAANVAVPDAGAVLAGEAELTAGGGESAVASLPPYGWAVFSA
ncbi:alpha-amylase family protein [Afifella sp. IM 167]|uniref:alpha-amylase family protein n=1 Tax=Afifella sp. IM 167 TaxID=2033586 RepID=UPI001CCC2972|nr:alpha-amylase family protein [Afifella sp. IM 167]MBZ8131703.1 alpha-amylase [Afifella sp. IM 167]